MPQNNASNTPLIPLSLLTEVSIPSPLRELRVTDSYVFLGSCFAQSVGSIFEEAGITSLVNPLGAVYNPSALARLLRLGRGKNMGEEGKDVETMEGPLGWHTWLSGTALTRATPQEARRIASETATRLSQALATCHNLFLTFGTNRTFLLASTGEVVINCHKHPSHDFREELPPTEQMTEDLDEALTLLHERNPQLIVTLTVSPYRYAGLGLHPNALSKASLLLMVDAVQRRHPEWVQYFPAFEIVLDELRDYRFYADDMLHPSPLAVQYVLSKLIPWMHPTLSACLHEAGKAARANAHRQHLQAP